MASAMRCSIAGVADSPIRRPFISTASTMAMATSSRPMATLPTASKRGLPVTPASTTPTEREDEADQRADVLEQHDGQLGLLGAVDEPPPARRGSALTCRDSRTAVRSEKVSSTIGDEQDDDGDAEVLDLVRVAQLLDALVEGEQAAHAEQHEGHDEGPEVALPAVAEGVLGRGRLAGPVAAEEQQQPGCRCRPASGSPRPAGRRPGDEEPDELGDGDAEVGEERGEDRLAAALVHAVRLAQA